MVLFRLISSKHLNFIYKRLKTLIMTNLKKCSKCRCTVMLSYFSTNRKGESYKTCNTCRAKNVECPKCEYRCSTNSHLTEHIKQVHDKIKDVECQKCNMKFSTKGNLEQHNKGVHTRLKILNVKSVIINAHQKVIYNDTLNESMIK